MGMREDRSPYQMRAATLLPKFDLKTPEVSDLRTDASEPVPRAKGNVLNLLKRLNPFRKVQELKRENGEESVSAVNPSDGISTKSIFRKSFFPARAKKHGESVKPVRTLVQSELSLESVRVVRNDLCDTDLEIVACFRQREAVVARGGGAQPQLSAATEANQSAFSKAGARPGWSRLTARLFDTSGIGRD